MPGASPRCRLPAAADAVPRSRGPNLSSAALLAPGQGPDPGLKSAAGAWAPGGGAGALSSPGRRRPRLRLPDRGYHHCTSPSWQVLLLTTSTTSQRSGFHHWGLADPLLNLCSTRRGEVGRPMRPSNTHLNPSSSPRAASRIGPCAPLGRPCHISAAGRWGWGSLPSPDGCPTFPLCSPCP